MRRASLVVASALILAACGGSSGGGSSVTSPGTPAIPSTPSNPVLTTDVVLQNTAFSPENIQVSPSAVVTFTNNDGGTTHNVTFTSGAIASVGNFSSGAKTVTMPATAGTYAFHCTLHAGMAGNVIVK